MANIQISINWAIATCNSATTGYSMDWRNQQIHDGITYYDCSSFIWYALQAGGFNVVGANNGNTWPFTTYTMPDILSSLGFGQIDSANDMWYPGDICITYDQTHCEMVYQGAPIPGNGTTMGAHGSSYYDENLGEEIPIPLDEQVSINSSSSSWSYFKYVYRFGGTTAPNNPQFPPGLTLPGWKKGLKLWQMIRLRRE